MAALAYSLCSWTSCASSPASSAAMDSHQVLITRPTPSPSVRLERQAQLPPLPTCSPPNPVARSTTAAVASSPCRRRREVLMKPQLHLVPLPVTNAVAPRAIVGELPYQQQFSSGSSSAIRDLFSGKICSAAAAPRRRPAASRAAGKPLPPCSLCPASLPSTVAALLPCPAAQNCCVPLLLQLEHERAKPR
ncbi:uncharacterized protein LOC125553903 isoform X2 [Triticum urartu]|nr:uncharacterized protein LOC125512230 isoform X2 [Triticum urartu]XP_048573511.1 uncharacterized protein LOC125553903 isoform X2 [Triticum urartu]